MIKMDTNMNQNSNEQYSQEFGVNQQQTLVGSNQNSTVQDAKNRELEVKEPQTLSDGKHSGIIEDITYRDTPYEYVDLSIKPDNSELSLKVGYPQNVSPNSALGKLLTRFGINLENGKKVNLYQTFINKKVDFVTISENIITKDNRNLTISRIVNDSKTPRSTRRK